MTVPKLENFTLAEIDAVTAAKHFRIVEAMEAKAKWERSVAGIRLLLEANPDWKWRDAVELMRDTGTMPEITS